MIATMNLSLIFGTSRIVATQHRQECKSFSPPNLLFSLTHVFDRMRMQIIMQRSVDCTARSSKAEQINEQITHLNTPAVIYYVFACRSVHRVGCSNRQRRRNTQQRIILISLDRKRREKEEPSSEVA